MSVFKRFSDIVNSNISAMLDKAENPEKMLNLIISEMEQTLFDVRSTSAKTIADKKHMQRALTQLEKETSLWQERAEKALAKEREDLAKQALMEKRRVEQAITAQTKELDALEQALLLLDQDLSMLQAKLNEAVARRKSLVARHEVVTKTVQLRQKFDDSVINEAIHRFDRFEAKMDKLEAQVEAFDLGRNASLSEQIDSLDKNEVIDAELAALKQRLKAG
ncbi:PspA/IM30 family protein [Aliikangiella sp. IMCC44632]